MRWPCVVDHVEWSDRGKPSDGADPATLGKLRVDAVAGSRTTALRGAATGRSTSTSTDTATAYRGAFGEVPRVNPLSVAGRAAAYQTALVAKTKH